MISQWTLQNFKAVHRAVVPLNQLTILSGVNSSGKSTVLQSMAMIAQTAANQVENETLILNGFLVSLGDFRSIKSRGPNGGVTIGWHIAPAGDPTATSDEQLLATGGYATTASVGLESISCEVTFYNAGTETQQRPQVQEGSLQVVEGASNATRLEWSRDKDGEAQAKFDDVSTAAIRARHADPASARCVLRHFLPNRLKVSADATMREAEVRADYLSGGRTYQAATHPLLQNAMPTEIRQLVVKRFPRENDGPGKDATLAAWAMFLREELLRGASAEELSTFREEIRLALVQLESTHRTNLEHQPLPGSLPKAVLYTESFFATKFKYLGPLRDEPRAVYAHPTKLDPVDVGRRGEHTAAVYHAYREQPVLHLDVDELANFGPIATARPAKLKNALDEWVRYLGVAEHVSTREEKHGHVLLIGTGPAPGWEIVHVGTGVSQILPILVLGLLAQCDDTIVIEHPELHLHPRVQSRLGDFFLFLALTGRQVIVETHSEHIINRVRRRIAGDAGGELRTKISIVFAESGSNGTEFRGVPLNEYGMIEPWPDGFFDEAIEESDAIVEAALARKEESR